MERRLTNGLVSAVIVTWNSAPFLRRCLAALDVPCTAAGVGDLYGARSAGGILDAWLVDTADAGTGVAGVPVRAHPLWMSDEAATLAIVREALAAA